MSMLILLNIYVSSLEIWFASALLVKTAILYLYK